MNSSHEAGCQFTITGVLHGFLEGAVVHSMQSFMSRGPFDNHDECILNKLQLHQPS